MATADTQDVWTETKCIQLIREFRNRPILWDQKNPMYYKKAIKTRAWIQISKVLNIPADSCTHKMVILMSSFRREKAKVVNHLKNGKDPLNTYHSTWFGFKEMSFLMDKDSERKRKSMETTDVEEDDTRSESKTLVVNHPLKKNKYLKRPSLEDDEQDIRYLKTQRISVRDDLKDDQDLMEQSTLPQIIEDEIKYFSNFIASKMMKYDERTKNAVQQAICEVIFKADMNFYEPKLNENSTRSCDNDPLDQPSCSDITQLPSSSDGRSIKIYYSDSD